MAMKMSDEMKSAARNFKQNWSRKPFPSNRLKEVNWALDQFMKAPTKGTLDSLNARVVNWGKTNPKEFKNNAGGELWMAVDGMRLDYSDVKKEPEPLKDGDILFRYLPHQIGQRNTMHGLISVGQGVQPATQNLGQLFGGVREVKPHLSSGPMQFLDDYIEDQFGNDPKGEATPSSIGSSWDTIQHVGIYVKRNETDAVIEIGWGLEKNQANKRAHEYDLVVRCDDPANAARVSKIALRARADWKQTCLIYPFLDLLFLATSARTGGSFDGHTHTKMSKMRREYVGNGTSDQLDQMVVCSHFVHAVLWAAADPVVTLKAATTHRLENVFKISPSHLWAQFCTGQGVWAKLPASFKGIQQHGQLVQMARKDLKGLALAA